MTQPTAGTLPTGQVPPPQAAPTMVMTMTWGAQPLCAVDTKPAGPVTPVVVPQYTQPSPW